MFHYCCRWWRYEVSEYCKDQSNPAFFDAVPDIILSLAISNTTGAAGKFFKALGSAQVNILAISQGSSERIISAVVKGSDSTKSLRAVHAAFLLSNQVRCTLLLLMYPTSFLWSLTWLIQVISVGLVGRGKVARAMIDVIREQADMLYGRYGTEFHLRAIMDSKHMVLSDTGVDLANVDKEFEDKKR